MNWEELEQELRDGLRAKRGSQTEVARRMGIKQPSVAGYVTGGENIPTSHITTILDVLGKSIDLKDQP